MLFSKRNNQDIKEFVFSSLSYAIYIMRTEEKQIMKDYYFEVVNKEKFRGMITEVCYEYGLTYMDTIHELVGGVTAYLDNTLLRTLTPFPRLITEGIPVGSDSLYVKVYLDLGDYGERKLLYSFTLNSGEFKTIKV